MKSANGSDIFFLLLGIVLVVLGRSSTTFWPETFTIAGGIIIGAAVAYGSVRSSKSKK